MHVVPYLKDAPLPNIKVSDLNPVLDVLRDRPALQKSVHAVMRKLFNWAEKRDDIEKSPMAKMDVPPGVKRRRRVLWPGALVALCPASHKLDGSRGAVGRVALLTPRS